MSWCDKLASTPTIGLKLNFHYAPPDQMLGALSPIVDAVTVGDTSRISLNQYDLAPAIAFTTHDGFKYSADGWKLSVAFQHMLRTKTISGGPPIMEMLSTPMPFTKLLPRVGEKLKEAALLVDKIKPRTILRIGIVSTTQVAEDDVPPGIVKFIDYLGRPWKQDVESFNCQITSILGETSAWSDRCLHTLIRPDPDVSEDDLITLQFDWQRRFKSGRAVTPDTLDEMMHTAQKHSLTYFEELAEGNHFDEDIIRDSISA